MKIKGKISSAIIVGILFLMLSIPSYAASETPISTQQDDFEISVEFLQNAAVRVEDNAVILSESSVDNVHQSQTIVAIGLLDTSDIPTVLNNIEVMKNSRASDIRSSELLITDHDRSVGETGREALGCTSKLTVEYTMETYNGEATVGMDTIIHDFYKADGVTCSSNTLTYGQGYVTTEGKKPLSGRYVGSLTSCHTYIPLSWPRIYEKYDGRYCGATEIIHLSSGGQSATIDYQCTIR